jgi:hypothetical protein
MSYSAQQCFERARECELMASEAKDSRANGPFVECARQWRELARQKEFLTRIALNLVGRAPRPFF